MVIDLDADPGRVVVRAPDEVLGIQYNDAHLTADQARAIAANLDARGEHTVIAEGLRRAADQAESRRPAC